MAPRRKPSAPDDGPSASKKGKGKAKDNDAPENASAPGKGKQQGTVVAGHQLAASLMAFAVRRGNGLFAVVQTNFEGITFAGEFRQLLPDFPPVHDDTCPAEYRKWQKHWADIRKAASHFLKIDMGRMTLRAKHDWSVHGPGAVAFAKAFPTWIRAIDKALQAAMLDFEMDVKNVHASCSADSRGPAGMPVTTIWDTRKVEIMAKVFGREAVETKFSMHHAAETLWKMWLSTELDRFKKVRNRALKNMGRIRAELGTRLKAEEFYKISPDDVAESLSEDDDLTIPQLRALVKKIKDYRSYLGYVAHPEEEDEVPAAPYGDEEDDDDDSENLAPNLAAAEERLKRAEVEEAQKAESVKITEWADLAMGSILGVIEARTKKRVATPKQKRTLSKSARRGRDRGRVVASQVKIAATEEELEAFALEMSDHLQQWDRGAREGELPDFEDIWIGEPDVNDEYFKNADTGTEAFAKKPPEELDALLGWLPGGRPAAFREADVDGTPLEVMWHQKTAVASILARAFEPTTDRGPHEWGSAPGMLVTDAVGTGKTVVGLALAAALIQLHGLAAQGLTRPPIATPELGSHQFCGCPSGIPDAPHLIVAPGTILEQWVREARRFFKDGAVVIIKVEPQASKWADALLKLEDKSCPDIRKIVFVQHSTVNSMGSKALLPGASDELKPLTVTENGRKTTLFGRRFASVWVDEAHEYRTGAKQWRCCNTLINGALLKTLATATPLKQHPRDIFFLAILARIPRAMAPETQQYLRAILADLARVKQKSRKDSVPADLPAGGIELNTSGTASTTPHRFATHIVHQIRQAALPRTIRRTTDSLRWDGKRIGDELPQNSLFYVMVPMTEEEIAAAGVYTNAEEVNFDTTNENFFFEPRRQISFPGKAAHNNYEDYVFRTVEQWLSTVHSKMTILIELCKLLLRLEGKALPPWARESKEAEQVIEVADLGLSNEPGYVPLPNPGVMPEDQEDIKVVIHTEWTMHHPLIQSALTLAGIKHVTLNGTVPAGKRQAVVDKFKNSRDIRVLLMSSVGAEGVNMTFATCMIIYDVGWSAVNTTQLKGRLHRKGQTKPTYVFQLVGRGTLDATMIMAGILKNRLLGEFLLRDAESALAEYKLVKMIGSEEDAELVRARYGFDDVAVDEVKRLLEGRKRSAKDEYPTTLPDFTSMYVPPEDRATIPAMFAEGSASASHGPSGSGTRHTGTTPPPKQEPPSPEQPRHLSRQPSPAGVQPGNAGPEPPHSPASAPPGLGPPFQLRSGSSPPPGSHDKRPGSPIIIDSPPGSPIVIDDTPPQSPSAMDLSSDPTQVTPSRQAARQQLLPIPEDVDSLNSSQSEADRVAETLGIGRDEAAARAPKRAPSNSPEGAPTGKKVRQVTSKGPVLGMTGASRQGSVHKAAASSQSSAPGTQEPEPEAVPRPRPRPKALPEVMATEQHDRHEADMTVPERVEALRLRLIRDGASPATISLETKRELLDATIPGVTEADPAAGAPTSLMEGLTMEEDADRPAVGATGGIFRGRSSEPPRPSGSALRASHPSPSRRASQPPPQSSQGASQGGDAPAGRGGAPRAPRSALGNLISHRPRHGR